MSSSIQTNSYGGNGGERFALSVVKELGLRGQVYLDQIRINGQAHGREGGHDVGSITLSEDEYINKIYIRAANYVDKVVFYTNKGREIGVGGNGGKETTLSDIRVIAIGGKSGKYVDNLNIMYATNYKPSTVVERNAGFIVSYSPPFEEFEEYKESFYKTVDSYEKITEHMLTQTYSASVEAEYYAKVSASTKIEIKTASLETVRNELEQRLTQGSFKSQKIPEKHVGIKLVRGNLLKEADEDVFWLYPTSITSYTVLESTEYKNVLDHYDLTGELFTQMPELKQYKKEKNGFDYYAAP